VNRFPLMIVLIISLVAVPALVYGQGKMAIGGGLELAFPMGDFGDAANMGFGVTLGGVYHYQPQIDFLASLGYISYGTESDAVSFSMIPIQFGGRYLLTPKNNGGPYVGALLGLHMVSSKVESVYIDDSETKTKFSFAPMAGYELKMNEQMSLDLSARYQIVSDASYFGIRAGINYGLK
jgi:opacity protein-like surface antigen